MSKYNSGRKRDNEKRIERIEKYFEGIKGKVGQVAEDSDNLRFLISLVRRQEMNAMQMKQHLDKQNEFLGMVQVFLKEKELEEEFKEHITKMTTPPPPAEEEPPTEEVEPDEV